MVGVWLCQSVLISSPEPVCLDHTKTIRASDESNRRAEPMKLGNNIWTIINNISLAVLYPSASLVDNSCIFWPYQF